MSSTENPESLGLLGVDMLHYYVRDLDRSRRFYVDKFDFVELGHSSPQMEQQGQQRSIAFGAGEITVLCSAPAGQGGRAWRYLNKHPDGIGTIMFRVQDIEHCFALLESRGGTPLQDIQSFEFDDGRMRMFSLATPFGDATFRFIEREGRTPLFPGFVAHNAPKGGNNRHDFSRIDHITSNFQTMSPALLWLEHVMGMQRYWDVAFHTRDIDPAHKKGSGLRSSVFWDPGSGIKFANNEPWRPCYKQSQINIFNEDHRGDGIQHIALAVQDIVQTVTDLRGVGVEFMPTPQAYYQKLPTRLQEIGVGSIDESIQTLQKLGILVDGQQSSRYMLQIFLKDSASLYSQADAGPFFYEIIQRKGDKGFGAGNFRALFESIEREQKVRG